MSEEDDLVRELQQAQAIDHAVSGAMGGALALAVTYPLQSITTRLQTNNRVTSAAATQNGEKPTKEGVENVAQGNPVMKLVNAVKQLIEENGVSGLYSGFESAMVGMVITNFVYYYFYEGTRSSYERVRGGPGKLSTFDTMATGAIAGVITAVSTNPIWVANTRMTVKKSDKNTISAMIEMVQTEGVSSLFSGVKPALILVINPIIQYTIFEELKKYLLALKNANGSSKKFVLTANWAFVLGALGKLAATTITYPYITVKTRQHVNKNKDKASSDITQSLINIVKKEGFAGLYKGYSYKICQSVLTVALLFYFKEGLLLRSIRMMKLLRSVKGAKTVPA